MRGVVQVHAAAQAKGLLAGLAVDELFFRDGHVPQKQVELAHDLFFRDAAELDDTLFLFEERDDRRLANEKRLLGLHDMPGEGRVRAKKSREKSVRVDNDPVRLVHCLLSAFLFKKVKDPLPGVALDFGSKLLGVFFGELASLADVLHLKVVHKADESLIVFQLTRQPNDDTVVIGFDFVGRLHGWTRWIVQRDHHTQPAATRRGSLLHITWKLRGGGSGNPSVSATR